MRLKASRASVSIKQSVFSNNIKPFAVLRIFDALGKPIVLYNCEKWSGFKSCYKIKSVEEIFEVTFKGQNEFNKIFTRFSKIVLGLHSKALNFAVFSELGQYPLIISAIVSCINLWFHVMQSNTSSLIYKFIGNNVILNSNSLWLNFVKNVLCELGFSHVWENHSTPKLTSLRCYNVVLTLRFGHENGVNNVVSMFSRKVFLMCTQRCQTTFHITFSSCNLF